MKTGWSIRNVLVEVQQQCHIISHVGGRRSAYKHIQLIDGRRVPILGSRNLAELQCRWGGTIGWSAASLRQAKSGGYLAGMVWSDGLPRVCVIRDQATIWREPEHATRQRICYASSRQGSAALVDVPVRKLYAFLNTTESTCDIVGGLVVSHYYVVDCRRTLRPFSENVDDIFAAFTDCVSYRAPNNNSQVI